MFWKYSPSLFSFGTLYREAKQYTAICIFLYTHSQLQSSLSWQPSVSTCLFLPIFLSWNEINWQNNFFRESKRKKLKKWDIHTLAAIEGLLYDKFYLLLSINFICIYLYSKLKPYMVWHLPTERHSKVQTLGTFGLGSHILSLMLPFWKLKLLVCVLVPM